MMALIINIVFIFLSATLVASHNLTDSEVMAFDPPEEIKVAFPYYLSGYDKDQVPIWIFEAGKWDMRKYAELGGEQYDAMDVHVHKMFLTFKESALNSSAQQYIAIADMEGLNIRQAGHLKTVQFIIQQFERLEKIARNGLVKLGFILNSNLVFEGILKLGIPLLVRFISEGIHNVLRSLEITTEEKWRFTPRYWIRAETGKVNSSSK
ncbi:unnamed protein product [Allacma fusca]|uniref:CRAL-TRIO domain-containing protein n=1 Tax=Allacma fusca TaxID=39272 RepID=A0A8J2Q5E5_9HEXA|nr:unnamed protein product [Allacma fusca]